MRGDAALAWSDLEPALTCHLSQVEFSLDLAAADDQLKDQLAVSRRNQGASFRKYPAKEKLSPQAVGARTLTPYGAGPLPSVDREDGDLAQVIRALGKESHWLGVFLPLRGPGSDVKQVLAVFCATDGPQDGSCQRDGDYDVLRVTFDKEILGEGLRESRQARLLNYG
jgi:hypothetical protein